MVKSNQQRELVSIVVTTDGRRVPVPFTHAQRSDASPLGVLRQLVQRFLALLTGSGPGGVRRTR